MSPFAYTEISPHCRSRRRSSAASGGTGPRQLGLAFVSNGLPADHRRYLSSAVLASARRRRAQLRSRRS
jgi:hypothetical protein